MNATIILTVEEPTSPLVLLKRVQGEEHLSPLYEVSSKWIWITKNGTYGEVTHFIKIPDIFYSRFPRTLEKAVAIVSTSNLSFAQNLPEGDKIEMASELAHNMFKAASICSFVFVGHDDVLALGSPFKKRDTWKGNVKVLELKCNNI